MSRNSRSQGNEMVHRLQATAASFTPLGSQSNDTLPLGGQQHDAPIPDGSESSPIVFQVSVYVAHPNPELTNSKTDVDCTICLALGRLLDCCQTRTNSRPCLQCAELSQLFTLKSEKHEGETADLREKLRRIEAETPEEKLTRLCADENAKIDELKSQVAKVIKEDELLMAENEELEKKLKRLEAEVKEAQPAAEFKIREKKGKKK
ncbi:hypothetical protein G6011_09224 [Alternaria panax]|uniref:Uncharacterized protein n=1 Tax=Alternaria panax TaxID=48097 RepID=A0AAD4NM99_9PLEO|nr:hypothetical protein G6011_09224 [Alternaria panax]